MPKWKTKYVDKEKLRRTRNQQRKRNYQKTAKYKRRKWTLKEDELVLAHNISDVQLSEKIKRSVQAIQTRRCKLKKQ